MPNTITSDALLSGLNNKKFTIIDCRPSAAYNGWILNGESRGGHIPGAFSIPASWFNELDKNALSALLADKIKNINLVITGYDEDIVKTKKHLESLGHKNITVHRGGMPDWTAVPDRPVETLAKYRQLVHADWLQSLLNGDNPEPESIKKYVLCHVNFDNWGDYNAGHITGAIWLDTLMLESEYTWNRHTPDVLEKEISGLGITKDTTVILYGRNSGPNMTQEHPGKQAGQLASMRAALILMYAGIRDVRVLDGGLESWLNIGGAMTTDEFGPVPVKQTGLKIPEHPELIVDTPQAKEMIAGKDSELVSMRSWEEITGQVSGYHYIEKKGRIKGSLWGDNGSDAYHMENNRNHDNTMLAYPEIEARWKKIGIVREKYNAFYCGTGWRASEAFFCAWLMGWPRVSIYDGGWFEWSSGPANPVETGIPERKKLNEVEQLNSEQ